MKRTINIERVIHSFTVIARAINYVVRTPKIWIYLVLPFIINVILSLLLFQFVKTQFADLIEGLVVLEWFPKWQWLATFLNYLSFIIVVLLTIFAFLIMGTIVSSPFNGIIVEKILDKHEIKKMDRYSGIGLIFFEIWRAIKFEFIKIILSILVLLLTLIINLIPVVGSILFVIINYLFNAYISVLDLQDASLSRLDLSFVKKTKIIIKNADLNLGFGLISSILLTIPLINFLYLPIASIAGTLLFIESQKTSKV